MFGFNSNMEKNDSNFFESQPSSQENIGPQGWFGPINKNKVAPKPKKKKNRAPAEEIPEKPPSYDPYYLYK